MKTLLSFHLKLVLLTTEFFVTKHHHLSTGKIKSPLTYLLLPQEERKNEELMSPDAGEFHVNKIYQTKLHKNGIQQQLFSSFLLDKAVERFIRIVLNVFSGKPRVHWGLIPYLACHS
mmetsp:Transcript_33667/g.49281  ORF Transcript_33667/g.49281 Transcript_33667/m.49281 type:complete len:117 (-) Transcript_33667:586-936(-)